MMFFLAPMEKMVDPAFRTICHKYGADATFTELVRFETLAKGNKSALRRIVLYDETPTYIQIMGKREDKLEQFLSQFEPPDQGFLGFNLNLGCPSQNYTNQGVGCAMVKRPTKVNRIVGIIKDHGYSINVKIRLGMTRKEKEEQTYIKLIERVDADFFTVHARYRSESYRKPADWSVFPACVATGKQIIANGDISASVDIPKLEAMGLAGVMIGRQALIDPLIFAKMKGINPIPSLQEVWGEYLDLASSYDRNFANNIMNLTEEDLLDLKG